MLLLDVVTLTFAGLLVGNEFAIAAFVHPALYHLPDEVHLTVAPAYARVLGRAMPVWYALAVLLVVADAWVHWHVSGRAPRLLIASAILWALAIVYTIVAEVPINNRIAGWPPRDGQSTAPANWRIDRMRWDALHRWRVLLLTVAFVLLAAGLV